MNPLLVAVLLLILLFGFVVAFGPPYLPTKRNQIQIALDLLDLKPGQTLLDLGSGDGRIIKAAAQRGWHVVGIELNPLLVLVARLSTWRYRKRVRIIWGNYFTVQWPAADGVFAFMIPRQMAELDRRMVRVGKSRSVKLASFAFRIPGRKSIAQKDGVYLYEYK